MTCGSQSTFDKLCCRLLLLYIAMVCTVFDVSGLHLGAGGVSVHLTDLLIFFALMLGIRKRSFSSPISFWCVIVFLIGIVVTAVNVVFFSLDVKEAIRALRMFILYLLPLVFINVFKSGEDVERFARKLILLGILTSFLMILQYVVGPSVQIISAGRIEDLKTMGELVSDVTRILPPGQTLVLFSFLYVLSKWLDPNVKTAKGSAFILLVILSVSVLLTFNRSFWVSVVGCVFIISYYFGIRVLVRNTLTMFFLSGLILIALFMLPKNKISNAVLDRLDTIINISDTVESDRSLLGRWDEYSQAWQAVKEAPLGRGLGADWRSVPEEMGKMSKYTHNGYLWIMLKLGMFGVIAYAGLFLSAWRCRARIASLAKSSESITRSTVSFSFIVAVYASNFVNPMFYQNFSIPVFAFCLGVLGTELARGKG